MSFVAIKRSINNDNKEEECDELTIKYFYSKMDAADWLTDQVEYNHLSLEESAYNLEDWASCKERSVIFNFFCQAQNEDAFFQWEWKRRGNKRTYRILSVEPETNEVKFFLFVKRFYKLKDGLIKEKT